MDPRVDAYTHRHTQTCIHAHGLPYRPARGSKATAVCLFVGVAVSGVFVIHPPEAPYSPGGDEM